MNRNIPVLIIVFCFFASCKNRTVKLEENQLVVVSVSMKTDSIDIPIDENTLKDYYLLSTYTTKSNVEKIVGYNDQLHALDNFDLLNKTVTHLPMDKEGPNGIARPIGGLYVHNEDSIWIYSQSDVFLLNSSGNIVQKIKLPIPADGFIMTDANYSLATNRLFYNKDRNSLFYSCTQPKEEIFNAIEYKLNNDSIKTYHLKGADPDKEIRSAYGLMQLPNVSFTDDCIVYNFPIGSNIYCISLDSGVETTYGGQSKYTLNFADKCKNPFTLGEAGKHSLENVHFYEVLYDKKKELYYRLHVDRSEMMSKMDFFKAYHTKNQYLMVFDRSFNVIDEIKLEKNKYSYVTSWGVLDRGFFMTKNHLFDDKNDFEKYQLDFFDFYYK